MRIHQYAGNRAFGRLQTKLTINEPGDAYEVEADRVADHVMRMPEPRVQRKCVCGGTCNECQEEEEGPPLRRAVATPAAPVPVASGNAAAPPIVHDVLRAPGEPLDAGARAFLESRMGADLEHVRVHADPAAAASAHAVRAFAYTVGRHIVFGAGRYQPQTEPGRRLLAHEAAHVLQGAGDLQRAAFHDHCGAVSGRAPTDCGGTIDVRAGAISPAVVAVSHLYLVFTDRHGVAFGFRGGPDRVGGGYGHTATQCGPYDETFADWDPSAPSERVYDGDAACEKAQCFRDQLRMIAATDTTYVPTGPNSNSVVTGLLRHCGLPVRKPPVTAPGFNLEITDAGVREAPEAQDRRHRIGLGVASGTGVLTGVGLGASYSVDLAQALNLALRFPLRLGTEVSPESGAFLGSASIGFEMPLLNIPLPGGGRVPTSFGLSTGILGGAATSPVGEREGLLGMEVLRAYVGLDIGRWRVSPSYRLEWLHNLQTNRDLWENTFGLEVGVTF